MPGVLTFSGARPTATARACTDPDHANDRSGCAAVALLITPDNRLFCANAGDSRCVLSRAGVAVPLSYDHKPDNPGEERRIVRAGGYMYGGRVNGTSERCQGGGRACPRRESSPDTGGECGWGGGSARVYLWGFPRAGNLALSRAIGDFMFKTNAGLPAEEQMVTGTQPPSRCGVMHRDLGFTVWALPWT